LSLDIDEFKFELQLVSCHPVIGMALSFTPGFSQVAMFTRNRKPFKRFLCLMEHFVTWLKPGVNEKKKNFK